MASSHSSPEERIPLHYNIITANLFECIEFYSKVLNYKILRHEEFKTGCEAQCNGKYDGYWSKSILGRKGEDVNFCLEIINNYVVDESLFLTNRTNNAFHSITVYDPKGTCKQRALAYYSDKKLAAAATAATVATTTATVNTDESFCFDFDGNRIDFFHKELNILAEEGDIIRIDFNVNSLANATEKFYNHEVFGTTCKFTNSKNEKPPKTTTTKIIEFLRLPYFRIVLTEIGEPIHFDNTKGRLAISTEDGAPDSLKERVEHVIFGPSALPPHNEKVIVVTDPDSHEFAFVERSGYKRCMESGEKSIDWAQQKEIIDYNKKQQKKRQKT